MRELRGYSRHKRAVEDLLADCRSLGRGKTVDLGVYGSTRELRVGQDTLLCADILCGASLATVAEIIAAVPLQKSWLANILNLQVTSHSESLKFSEVMVTHVVKNSLDLDIQLATDCYET